MFAGDSLEEAMAAAVAALGPDLEVRRARKVRAGVRGLLGRDRYEVLAVPGDDGALPAPPAPGSGDALGDAFASLLDAADAHESGRPAPPRPAAQRRPARPEPRDDLDDVLPVRRVSRPQSRPLPPLDDEPLLPPRPVAPVLPDSVLPDVVLPDVVPPAPRTGSRRSRRSRRSAGPEVLPADGGARGRADRGAALADSSPHPDPAVADHPGPAAPAHPADEPTAPPQHSMPQHSTPQHPTPQHPTAQGDPPVTGPDDTAADPELRDDPRSPRRGSPAHPEPGSAAPRRPAAAGVRRRWSRATLVSVGVPDAVLEQLPPAAPLDDLAWVVALTAAIGAVVPAPAEVDEDHPVVVSGFGLEGAIAVLEAGVRGQHPGTVTHAGRTAPATATELALVLRHHVNDGG